MHEKLISSETFTHLHKGDILWKYPLSGSPENTFDEQNEVSSEAYEIRFINPVNNIMELVMTADSCGMFASPGDIGRLYTRFDRLLLERVWWR